MNVKIEALKNKINTYPVPSRMEFYFKICPFFHVHTPVF